MFLAPRSAALALIAVLALVATGCSSNNKGKIVGKWASPNGPVFEFTADGRFVVTAPGGVQIASARYSLGAGDNVTLSDLSPATKDGKTRSRERIAISGDSMTITGSRGDQPLVLTRMK